MTLRTEYIDVDFNLKLQKDLQENEVICPSCGGVGLQVGDNPFGLKSDKGYTKMFPHKQQTIVSCQQCYNGVQKVCKHCGESLGRRSWQCNCEGYKNEQRNEQFQKDLAQWNEAHKITLDELINSDYNNMLYFENEGEYVHDVEDLINHILDNYSEEEFKSTEIMVYKTYTNSISFDVDDILENVTEDLHEEAFDNALTYVEDLQEILDKYAEKMKSGTTTYYPDYYEGVIITAEDIFKYNAREGR